MLLEIVGWLAASLIVIGALWGSWWLPRREARRLILKDDKERADVEDNFRKTIGQFFGGTAVLIGAWSAYSTLQASREQLSSQQDQTRRTLQASHEQLISQQVSKGFEQLGSEKLVVRLGGIYALEGVMNTSEQYHQPALETLCAFVRDGTKTNTGDEPLAKDIQAALTVIGRRASGSGVIDLTGAHIQGAHLSHLFGNVDLSGAILQDADLSSADLRLTPLQGAILNGARLNDADLSGAKLMNSKLVGVEVRGAHLQGADLTGAELLNADLSNADLRNAFVAQSQLNRACGDERTKLPSGETIPPCNH